MPLRSEEEQVVGLESVGRLVRRAGCECVIVPGGTVDVCFLSALGPPRPKEIVYAHGGYDVWSHGATKYLQPNITPYAAAKVVIDEYLGWEAKKSPTNSK